MSPDTLARPSTTPAASIRLAGWAVAALSLGLFAPEAGARHFYQWTVCTMPGEPCFLQGYGPAEALSSVPAFLLWSGVPAVIGAEGLARLGRTALGLRRAATVAALGLAFAAVQFYGLGAAKALYVKVWHLETAFFVASVALGVVLALALSAAARRERAAD